MLNFTEKQNKLALYKNNCNTSSGKFYPFIDPREAERNKQICNGLGIDIVDCKHPQKNNFIKEINGLDFSTVKAKKTEEIFLPKYIPVITSGFFNANSDLLDYDIVGISLKDIFTSPPKKYLGRLRLPKLKIKEDVLKSPIFQNKKVILFSSGQDVLIEKLWQKSEKLEYFKKLGNMGFYLATAINFSVFFGECPLAHAINLKRSLETFSLTQKYSTNSIPHIYWANNLHLDRWVAWLNKNPSVKFITINCQLYHKEDFPIIQGGIKYLMENVKNNINFLLEGPNRNFLKGLKSISHAINIAIKDPSLKAMNYRRYYVDDNMLKCKATDDITKEKILNSNTKLFELYLQETFFKNKLIINKLEQNVCQKETSMLPSARMRGR